MKSYSIGAPNELRIGNIGIISLLFVLIVSTLLYFLPVNENPIISPSSRWCYHYRETLIHDGKPIYEKSEVLRYFSVNITRGVLIVRMERTFEWKIFHENRTEVITSNASEETLFLVDVSSRMYFDGSYTSWWIPTNIFIGSSIPIWTINFNVKGFSWIMFNGKILECWVLEYRSAVEEYILLYERVTGIFIKYEIREIASSSQQLLRERWLTDSDIEWPILAFIRPFLLLPIIASLLVLVSLLIKKIRGHLMVKKKSLNQDYLLI
ncbi:MAG: hypothetical protein QXY30_02620 [Candidatus Bathyarchaeia archaeon]